MREDARSTLRSGCPCRHETEAGLHQEHEDQADHGPGKRDAPSHCLEQLENLDSPVRFVKDLLELI